MREINKQINNFFFFSFAETFKELILKCPQEYISFGSFKKFQTFVLAAKVNPLEIAGCKQLLYLLIQNLKEQ